MKRGLSKKRKIIILIVTLTSIFLAIFSATADLEYGCCEYSGGCFSGTLDPEKCRVCYGGTWSSGEKCCDDGNCHECCTDVDCPDGQECVDYVCEEVPEFPAGVTAVFGATLFIFLMMRRKYIRK